MCHDESCGSFSLFLFSSHQQLMISLHPQHAHTNPLPPPPNHRRNRNRPSLTTAQPWHFRLSEGVRTQRCHVERHKKPNIHMLNNTRPWRTECRRGEQHGGTRCPIVDKYALHHQNGSLFADHQQEGNENVTLTCWNARSVGSHCQCVKGCKAHTNVSSPM